MLEMVYCFATSKLTENEKNLKESLIESDREKEELEMKVSVLEREKAEQNQTVRY